MTSNIVESMNAANKAARDLSVATLVEFLQCFVQKWHWKHKQDASFTRTEVAPKLTNMLKDNYIIGLRMRVSDFDILVENFKNNRICYSCY